MGKKTSCTDWGANQCRKFIVLDIGQYRIILSARYGERGAAAAKPKCADNTGCLIEHFGNADAVPQPPKRCLSRKAGIVRYCHRLFIGSKVCFYHFTAIKGGIYRRKRSAQISQFFKVIPHNSKCRYGERGAAAAKPKAQIILDVLSSILATQMPCRSRRSGA